MNLSQDQKLNSAIKVLKSEFAPLRLFLFGSQVNGTSTESSDYDFVMVLKECTSEEQLEYMLKAQSLLAQQGISADIFVYSEEIFEQRRQNFNTIPEVAYSTGQELELT